jgi:hypothetical protein
MHVTKARGALASMPQQVQNSVQNCRSTANKLHILRVCVRQVAHCEPLSRDSERTGSTSGPTK